MPTGSGCLVDLVAGTTRAERTQDVPLPTKPLVGGASVSLAPHSGRVRG